LLLVTYIGDNKFAFLLFLYSMDNFSFLNIMTGVALVTCSLMLNYLRWENCQALAGLILRNCRAQGLLAFYLNPEGLRGGRGGGAGTLVG